MLFGLGELEFWGRTAELSGFSSAFECSFAVNLLYSLLINFGSFSRQRIDSWAEGERMRISGALAETPNFNPNRFERGVDVIKNRWGGSIKVSNTIVIIWAVFAACISAIMMLIGVAFYGKELVTAPAAMLIGVGLFGAIPFGLIACFVLHGLARIHMRMLAREWRKALEYVAESPSKTIAQARQALHDKPKGSRRT